MSSFDNIPQFGVLLVNLGTPQSPEPPDVARYLREFLMDPRVIDISAIPRWILVNAFIVPKRSVASSELYKKVWTREGSPLAVNQSKLANALQKHLGEGYLVDQAMRYGHPKIVDAVLRFRAAGVKQILCLPLYPQYSLAATQSSIDCITNVIRHYGSDMRFGFVKPFFRDGRYLDSVVEVSRPALDRCKWDKIIFSFHGLPEKQVKKTDPTSRHCLVSKTCCDEIVEANCNCYRAQCFETARQLAKRLELRDFLVAFQSRMAGSPWIRPFTDEYYTSLPKSGVRRLAVICPSFVADCLETLEEVQIRGRKQFIEAGGEELTLIPSLNDSECWVRALGKMIKEYREVFSRGPAREESPYNHERDLRSPPLRFQ